MVVDCHHDMSEALCVTRSQKKRKKLLFTFIEQLCANEHIDSVIMEYSKKRLSDKVFSPFNILRLMDLNGGKLNYEAA